MAGKNDDYFAAKAAWEKDHPGELYSTARHYRSGASARVLADYWTHYSESAPLKCEACGWEGLIRDGDIEPYTESFDVSCPKCERMLLVVPYPTVEETRAAALAGNVVAQRELARKDDE